MAKQTLPKQKNIYLNSQHQPTILAKKHQPIIKSSELNHHARRDPNDFREAFYSQTPPESLSRPPPPAQPRFPKTGPSVLSLTATGRDSTN